jgi:hypothetical protein
MSLFPHGSPTDLLGESSLLSTTGTDAGTDDNSDAESDNSSKSGTREKNPHHSREARVSRPVVPWVEYDIVRG